MVKRRQDAAIPKLPYLTTSRLVTCTLSDKLFLQPHDNFIPNALNGNLVKHHEMDPFWGQKYPTLQTREFHLYERYSCDPTCSKIKHVTQ